MIEFSCIIKNYTTKDGKRKFSAMSAKGKFLDGLKVKSSVPLNPETTYFLKFTQNSSQSLPAAEGIYVITIKDEHDNSDYGPSAAWLDERNGNTNLNVIRIKLDSCETHFEKKCDLKPFADPKTDSEKLDSIKVKKEDLPF